MGKRKKEKNKEIISIIIEIISSKEKGAKISYIIQKLKQKGAPENKNLLKNILTALIKEGEIIRQGKRYFVKSGDNHIKGRYIAARGGFGFVVPEEGDEDIFIPPKKTKTAITGDIVEVVVHRGKNGMEGEIISITERKYKSIIGYFALNRLTPTIIPLDTKIDAEVEVRSLKGVSVVPGMIVEGDIKEGKKGIFVNTIRKVFGFPDDDGVDLKVIISKYGFSEEFPEEVNDYVAKIPEDISSEIKRRKDLRKEIIFTIDGKDAKDFDDAISVGKTKTGYILGVHIADVSFYVKKDSPLDKEGFKRGNSVYFPETVIPMLPHKLSSNLCSLKEGVDRLTVSVEMEIDKTGKVLKHKVFPSVIKSSKRLTYEFAQEILDGKPVKVDGKVKESLLLMKELAEVLIKARERKGSLDFDLPESMLVYKDNKVVGITVFPRLFSNRLIEEFMLIANETIAKHLAREGIEQIFRIHEEPDFQKLEQLKEILNSMGFGFYPEKGDITKQLQVILKKAIDKQGEKFIHLSILKSMKLAKYSTENKGHFGLQKEFYCHYTSPIRRYSDLITHRLLKESFRKDNKKKYYDKNTLDSIAEQTSKTERTADESEKELIRWRIIRFMKTLVGEEFEGIITTFTQSSVIVELDDYFVEGAIPFYELNDDYYVLSDNKLSLSGMRTGKRLVLGDRLKVRLVSVDTLRQKLYFLPTEQEKWRKTEKSGKNKKKKKKHNKKRRKQKEE
jgi:ribonuclease R